MTAPDGAADKAPAARPRRPLFQKYFAALVAAVVVPLLVNGVSEAWFGYRDQRLAAEPAPAYRGECRRRQDPGFPRRHHRSAAMDRATAVDAGERRTAPLRRIAAAAPGAGGQRDHAGGRLRCGAAARLSGRPRCDQQRHRPQQRPGGRGRVGKAHLVRPGDALRRFRATYAGRGLRGAPQQRRHPGDDQPQTDLGRDHGDPGRPVGRRLCARPVRPASSAPRYQPGIAR